MEMHRTWTGPDTGEIAAWTLIQVGHVVARRFHAAFADIGLTPTQFGVLLELDLHPGMANGEMARAVLLSPQSMSELLSSLVKLGLIDRQESVGRGHRIPAQLTDRGQETLARCESAVAHVEASLGLTTEQHNALNDALHAVLNATEPS